MVTVRNVKVCCQVVKPVQSTFNVHLRARLMRIPSLTHSWLAGGSSGGGSPEPQKPSKPTRSTRSMLQKDRQTQKAAGCRRQHRNCMKLYETVRHLFASLIGQLKLPTEQQN